MSDPSITVKNLRDRLAGSGEDRLGKALSELLDNPLLTGAIGRAFDAREKAAQAQELAMGAFNIPSAADIERLTRRLRSVSQRLEGIEDGVHRLDRTLAVHGVESRLSKIEEQLGTLTRRLDSQPKPSQTVKTQAAKAPRAKARPVKARSGKPTARSGKAKPAARRAKPRKA